MAEATPFVSDPNGHDRNPWDSARRILCVRLDYIGDVLMCTPAIRALRESGPQREITLLTSAGGAAVAAMIAEIDHVLGYAAPWMKNSVPQPPQCDLDMIEHLRQLRFDAAVIFTTYSQSPLPAAMLCHLAGIPLRLAHCRENPYAMLTDWIPEPEPQQTLRHEVRRQLDLVAAIGAVPSDERLSFSVPEDAQLWARERLLQLGLDRPELDRWVLMHPGASAASRRYPPASWARAADLVAQQLEVAIVFSGSGDEVELINGIRAAMRSPSVSLAGELDLARLGAIIALAPVMVANNSGPAHIAAALGTPLVELYALTNPQHTPWQVPSKVLYQMVPCRNCYKSVCPLQHQHCLSRVEPERVLNAVRELLAEPVVHTEAGLLLA